MSEMTTVEDATEAVVKLLLADRAALLEQLAEHLRAELPEITSRHVEDLVESSLAANLAVTFDQLVRKVPVNLATVSPEVGEHTREMANRGFSLESVLRGYRITTVYLVDRWIDLVHEADLSAAVGFPVAKYGAQYLWEWSEAVTTQLAVEYELEARRLSHERSQARLEFVRELLESNDDDVEAHARELGFSVSTRHTALVIHGGKGLRNAETLDATLRLYLRGVSAARLTVHAGANTLWCWVHCTDALAHDTALLDAPVAIGVGRPGTGLAGFRRSHSEALAAVRVASLAATPLPAVVPYETVELAALCTGDPARAVAFVREKLAFLDEGDPSSGKWRETLKAYLAANCSLRRAAVDLGVHHNTVRYRIEQIERQLGSPLSQNRLSVELALQIDEALGVLKPR